MIWDYARVQEAAILADIATSFQIIGTHEVFWSPERVDANFHRFYRGEVEAPYGTLFRRQKGSGPFLVVVVTDDRPSYQLRNNTDGPSMVNARFLDAKSQYRTWTPGPMQVHATSSHAEAARDLSLLLGVSVEEYLSDASVRGQSSVQRDLSGADGWPDFPSLFRALTLSLSYIVLRNFENLPHDDNVGRHSGVDLLVRDYREAVRILGGSPEHGSVPAAGGRFLVSVGDRSVRFAIWPEGGGYFDPRWEQDLLRHRVFRDGVPTPNDRGHFDSLAYHAVVHKRIHHEDEWERLSALARQVGVPGWDQPGLDLAKAKALVDGFMTDNGYRYTVPDDVVSVYFNYEVAGSARPGFDRRLAHVRRLGTRGMLRVRRRVLHPFAKARGLAGHLARSLRLR